MSKQNKIVKSIFGLGVGVFWWILSILMCFSIKNAFKLVRNCYETFKYINKSSSMKLQMCGSEAGMREFAGRICKKYLHGAWKTVDSGDLEFRQIKGGLSNFLYYVALPDDPSKWNYDRRVSDDEKNSTSCTFEEPKKVLLRIYGQVHGERAMDAIVTESVIFTLLSERRLGPRLHGVFSGGRIEEYIPARPLKCKELAEPALSMKIAEKMAAIHCMDVPLLKEPTYIWKTMGKWLRTIREERFVTIKGKNEEEEKVIKRLKQVDLEKEMDWLSKFLSTVESPVVFCHNDMQEGNILLLEDEQSCDTPEYNPPYQYLGAGKENEDNIVPSPRSAFMETLDDGNTTDSHISDCGEPKLVLIDFEYCAYNYRAFDIANHFQEWGYDYTNPEHPFYFDNQENYPTLEQKEIFIKEYLKHYNAATSETKQLTAPSIEQVNKVLHEVEAFALASHLFWCMWSIVNAGKSQIPFGYWEYALSRLETYQQLKQEIVKEDSSARPLKRKICEVDI